MNRTMVAEPSHDDTANMRSQVEALIAELRESRAQIALTQQAFKVADARVDLKLAEMRAQLTLLQAR